MQTELIISIVSLLTAITGIYIARSTKKKNEGEATLAITEAAEKIVTMREKDAKLSEDKIDLLCKEVSQLRNYVNYLHDWIEIAVDGGKRPETYDEFLKRKGMEPPPFLPCS
jgi:hypothetical protein